DLFPDDLTALAEELPSGSGVPGAPTEVAVHTPAAPRPARPAPFPAGPGGARGGSSSSTSNAASRRLNEAGKAKIRKAVKFAHSLTDLAEIESALDSGQLSDGLARRLKLLPSDFEAARPGATIVAPKPVAAPLAAQGLTPIGLYKVRRFIEQASDLQKLAEVDKALNGGDIYRLRVMLDLQPEDIAGLPQPQPAGEKTKQPAGDEESDEEDDDYDPFATEPDAKAEEEAAPKKPKKEKKPKKPVDPQ
ncbi:unnamed protein product, partial [Polarella glacialis]